MSDISAVSGSGFRPEPVGLTDRVVARVPAPDETRRPSDRVELSDRARYLNKMAQLPEIRHDLVDSIRRQIAAGTYETEAKLDAAIKSLAEDLDLLA